MTTPGAAADVRNDRIASLKVAGQLIGVLAVVGAILGVVGSCGARPVRPD